MAEAKNIASEDILAGRRGLEGVNGVAILEDVKWFSNINKWVLKIQVSIETANAELVPALTEWFIEIPQSYPWGDIKIFPSKENSIVHVFHHQNHQERDNATLPWRKQDICVSTSVHGLGRVGYDVEPYDIHERLKWHVERTKEWLVAASEGKLIEDGDPFETPAYPTSKNAPSVVVFESEDSFKIWNETDKRCGYFSFFKLPGGKKHLVAESFFANKKNEIYHPLWGLRLKHDGKELNTGIWVLFSCTVFIPPWQAPLTWKELFDTSSEQGVDLFSCIQSLSEPLRDGKRHIALVGYPIPDRIGEKNCQIYWQALNLPHLSHGNKFNMNGFRANTIGYSMRDKTEVFKNDNTIEWINTENWNPDKLQSRGRLSDPLCSKNILIIGGGSFGSAFAELLVRGGVKEMSIADGEAFVAGNLCRHSLTIDNLAESKAEALATRLNSVSPHAKVSGIREDITSNDDTLEKRLSSYSLIIDCTGNDEILHTLSDLSLDSENIFISLSFGFRALRFFAFICVGNRFPIYDFYAFIGKWLDNEKVEFKGECFPREGVGCWHPVYPARADDMWLWASVAVKHIDKALRNGITDSRLTVFEQEEKETEFGVKVVDDVLADG